jgi:HEAT repeat protein
MSHSSVKPACAGRFVPSISHWISGELVILAALLFAPGCFSSHMPAFSLPHNASEEVRGLIANLYNPDPQVRAQACQHLQDRDDAEPAMPYLLGVIYDDTLAWSPAASDPYARTEVGHEAAIALGNIGSAAVVPLVAILQSDAPDKVRTRAVLGLDYARDPRAIPPLIDALETNDPDLHQACILALQRITGENIEKNREWQDWEWRDWLKRQGLSPATQGSR